MRIEQALAKATELPSESARADVEYLLCEVLGKDRTYLRTWPDRELSPDQQSHFLELFNQRLQGRPIAHITGSRGFWNFDLEVNPSTLIPRSDTEVLVETALELVDSLDARVVDLGTGTGAIALALALEHPNWRVEACDRILEAVLLARKNAVRLGAANMTVFEGSWFDPLSGRYQLIVSNPPYIDPVDPHLNQGDLVYEPSSALVADERGLADLHYIIDNAPNYLAEGGWLLMEHGYDQAETVAKRLAERGFSNLVMREDFGGNPRVSGGCWRSKC
ncbi:peptide chain release factor N(5)-glutamine methyltransferase [Marinobacterium sp. LSUCC0821]|uniref:peptide chain release factor N(5)-glutamine methyltransferase n=1 Tax=Marinobacterium sp. LSUCC0821 TaxID=2668067 RepID=UPI0014515BC4|nr:peptide chain release factor N(5)-glutamine methyltransferase [Marinobacterium sp. LSUCC0821]QJD70249.1 peptide chain release factor N(5)-glutamine methyltransferase [Marinobacterium sp. LSUCC0821]